MSVLIILFITAVLALFSGVYNQGKFARYIGILGFIGGIICQLLPECSFFNQYKSMFDFDDNSALLLKFL